MKAEEAASVGCFIVIGLLSAVWIAVLIWLCLAGIDWLGRH